MSGVILVVEDPFITSFLGRLLAKNGYRVVPASAQRALELIGTGAVIVNLLITNTPALFAEVGGLIPLLYLSACPDPVQASAFRNWAALQKPFQPSQLLDAVGKLLDGASEL